MKKFLIALMVAVSAASVVVTEAEAKRLGGGGSIGKQSQMSRQAPAQSPQNQATNANQAQPGAATPAAAAAAKPASPWKGMLGGALLGLGLGALLSHFGLGGAMASMISTILMVALLALAAMFLIRFFRNRNGANAAHQPAFAAGYPTARTPDIGSRIEAQAQPAAFQAESIASSSAAPSGVPADMDVPAFLRHAKTYFIRLQAAWDKGDVNDIREFTTPETFGELRLQLQERGASANHTDVVSLDAELLGVETVNNEHLASVRFSGLIKEEANAPSEPFAEVWNLTKPVAGQGGWVLAGIQQLADAK